MKKYYSILLIFAIMICVTMFPNNILIVEDDCAIEWCLEKSGGLL